eukprot:PITA_36513
MARTFDMKDLGAARQILGMDIFRDRCNGKPWLSQHKYIEKILLRFGMNNVKPVSVPLASHFKLSSSLCPNTDEEKEYMSRIPYVNVVGSLMYEMVCTRRDISHAVGVFSRYMANPGKEHWSAVKWVLWYLRGTSDYCITYNKSSEFVCRYVDSNFAGDLDKRRSTSGLQDNIKLFCDSQSAIHLAKNPGYHSKSKHIPIKYHFVRQVITERGVSLEKVHRKENYADMFMKPVLLDKLCWCLASLGLQKR